MKMTFPLAVSLLATTFLALNCSPAKAQTEPKDVAGGATYQVDPPGNVELPNGQIDFYESLTVSRDVCGDVCQVKVQPGTWLRWSETSPPEPEPPLVCPVIDDVPFLPPGDMDPNGNEAVLKDVPTRYGFSKGGRVESASTPDGFPHLIPSLIVFEGQDNTAASAQVQYRNARAYAKVDGQWVQTHSQKGRTWYAQFPANSDYFCGLGATCSLPGAYNDDGSIVTIDQQAGWNHHGVWDTWRTTYNATAVLVTLEARVLGPGQWLMNVGADWYDTQEAPKELKEHTGISASLLLGPQWRTITMRTDGQ